MKNTMKKPVNIPVSKLRPFEGHPFKVKDDAEMNIEKSRLLHRRRKCIQLFLGAQWRFVRGYFRL